MVVCPNAKVDPEAGPAVRVTVGVAQLSVAVGAVHVAVAVQEPLAKTVISVGQPEMTGAVLSTTITLKVQVAVFPLPSSAV